eukprot:Pgem_evm1s10655
MLYFTSFIELLLVSFFTSIKSAYFVCKISAGNISIAYLTLNAVAVVFYTCVYQGNDNVTSTEVLNMAKTRWGLGYIFIFISIILMFVAILCNLIACQALNQSLNFTDKKIVGDVNVVHADVDVEVHGEVAREPEEKTRLLAAVLPSTSVAGRKGSIYSQGCGKNNRKGSQYGRISGADIWAFA